MRAKITRTVPQDHPLWIGAPTSPGDLKLFNQRKMTELLRSNISNMGYESMRIEQSNSRGVAEFEFIVSIGDLDAEEFSGMLAASDDFGDDHEVVADDEDFESEGDEEEEEEEDGD